MGRQMARPRGSEKLIPIERFEDRLSFLIDLIEPNPNYLSRLRGGSKIILNIFNVDSLREAIASEDELPKERRFFGKAITGDRMIRNYFRDNNCSPVVIDYLAKLYDVDPRILRAPTYEQFLQGMDEDVAALSCWKAADSHLANMRGELAKFGKDYYSSIDELPHDFPLVGKRDWILASPKLLRPNDLDAPTLIETEGLASRVLSGLKFNNWIFRSRRRIRERMIRWGNPQYNGDCYRLMAAEKVADDIHFTFGLCKFFDYVNTCEANALELANWHLQISNGIPVGKEVRPFSGSPHQIMDFSNRAAYCGVNCLTVVKGYRKSRTEKPYDAFFIHPRDQNRTEARNTVHVIPAGGHQPSTIDWRNPTNSQIFMTACREFLEEMYDKKELAQQKETGGTFLDAPNIRSLYERIFDDDGHTPAARVFFHGFGFDPVTTKPEMLVTILVNWDLILERMEKPQLAYSDEGDAFPKILSENELRRQARGLVEPFPGTSEPLLPTLPAGAACMMLTANTLGKLKAQTDWNWH
jgi:hypothetical protein